MKPDPAVHADINVPLGYAHAHSAIPPIYNELNHPSWPWRGNPHPLGLWLMVALCVVAPSCRARSPQVGTAVVVLKTTDSIAIAADSREVRKAAKGARLTVFDGACKIIERHGAVFALADLAVLPNGVTVTAVAERIMARQLTSRDMVAEFKRQVVPILERDPSYLNAFPFEVKDGTSVMEVLFAKVENGQPALSWADFKVQIAGPRGKITPKGGELWSSPDDGLFFARAKSLASRSDFGIARSTLRDRRLAAVEVKRLVELVAADRANSAYVGGEIDVVTIGPLGIEWAALKPECK